MRDGGFGFHGVWQDLVQFINGLDIDRIKRKAGIKNAVHGVSGKDPPQTGSCGRFLACLLAVA